VKSPQADEARKMDEARREKDEARREEEEGAAKRKMKVLKVLVFTQLIFWNGIVTTGLES
jgi:hypothetical protein